MANGYEGLSAEQKEALYRAIEEAAPRARMEDYVAAIDYAVKRVGIDHVCLSSDVNHGFGAVQGWADGSETRNVTEALRRHGYDARQGDPRLLKPFGLRLSLAPISRQTDLVLPLRGGEMMANPRRGLIERVVAFPPML